MAGADGDVVAVGVAATVGLSFLSNSNVVPMPIPASPTTAPTIPAVILRRRCDCVCSAFRRAASFASWRSLTGWAWRDRLSNAQRLEREAVQDVGSDTRVRSYPKRRITSIM